MARYKIFKITDVLDFSDRGQLYVYLDDRIDFRDATGEPRIIIPDYYKSHRLAKDKYVEVDLDEVKKYGWQEAVIGALRPVSFQVAMANSPRHAMTNASASSVDPTALAITQQGIDSVNSGQIREFEYRMEDDLAIPAVPFGLLNT